MALIFVMVLDAAAWATGAGQGSGSSSGAIPSPSNPARPLSARPEAHPMPVSSSRQSSSTQETPAWLKSQQQWWHQMVGPASPSGGRVAGGIPPTPDGAPTSATMSAAEAQDAMSALSGALGVQLVLAGIPGMPQGVMQLRCSIG